MYGSNTQTGSNFIVSPVHEAILWLGLGFYLRWLMARQCIMKVLTSVAVCVYKRKRRK